MIKIECDGEDLNKAIYDLVVNELMNMQIRNPDRVLTVSVDICCKNDVPFMMLTDIEDGDGSFFTVNSFAYAMSDTGAVATVKDIPLSQVKRLLDHSFTALGII